MEFQGTVGDKERGFRERDAEQNRLDQIRDRCYKMYFSPSEAELVGTATLISVNNNPLVNLPAGADDAARFSFVKPKFWRNGKLRVVAYWSTDGTDTTDIKIRACVRDIGAVGSAMSNTTLLLETTDFTPTGVTSSVHDDEFTTMSNNVQDAHKVLTTYIQRVGVTDSNTDDAYYIGHTVEFLPASRQ